VSPGCMLGTIGKPLARRGARALFCDVLTYGGKIMDFQSFYELEKLENYIYLHLGCGNGTRHSSTDG